MISFQQAYDTVIENVFITGTEFIPLGEATGRIIARDIFSDIDMPPFNKASVDGFACRRVDLKDELRVIETIPAGYRPEKVIGPMQCSKIMTGAAVPDGADCVIMVEDTMFTGESKIRFTGSFSKENIAVKGEDIRKNDRILEAGAMLRPQEIALLASVGCTPVPVSKRPGVAVISSGSELVEPDQEPGPSQIRNSNALQLMAMVKHTGVDGKYYGIARDDEEETFAILSAALSENDIVIITGGVSMGDFDFIPAVMERAGIRLLFTRVAVQPGKPTTFGIRENKVVFGLPGNPVSSFIQFEMLVKPLIYRSMRYNWQPSTINLPMKEGFIRKFTDRMAIIPVKLTEDGFVVPVKYHGSAHISALHEAFGVIRLDAGAGSVGIGEIVSVRQI